MSYTPTTEEVREIYRGCLVQTDTNIYSFVDEAQADGEFDRWLSEVKAQERKAERERIKQRLWDDGYLYEMERDHVWALIEGETQ